MNTSHLVALHESLSRLKARYAEQPSELALVWIQQKEKELAAEYQFLGITPDSDLADISDDDLLAELQ